MIGMLQRSQAQVAVTMFSMTLQRKDVVDFTVPITLMRYAMYIQEKTLMKPNWMSFFAPFGQMLWITIIITIATMVAFLAAMGHWLGTSSIGHMDSLFIVFTVFTQQAPHPPLKPLSGSVAILTAQLTVLVLMAAYSGTLISFLTVRKIFMPFTDLAGFLKDGSYQLGVIEKTSEYDYFANNTDETMHKIYERLMKPNAENIVRSELDGLHRVCSARYAFLSSTYFMIEPLKQRNCSIIAVPIGTFQVPVAIIMNKASPYRELLDHNLQIMRRVGILKRLQLALSPKSTSPASESAIDVHLGHVMPLFFMLISGLITAVIVFCVEQGSGNNMSADYHLPVIDHICLDCFHLLPTMDHKYQP
ncbi:glutamate receptor ionotropic, kainate glr-3-like [Periplaneta americana]|uniref:glutamate receptor ionotropic, kainate glr-3-like n=1 Tax=Periplaneta americana TaxID=6978 RepID=UPI0037E85FCC